jgi:ribosomal protein S18 acetylase RimI-like enzyme
MVFVSRPDRPEETAGVTRLLEASVGGLSGVSLAQVLLTPDEGVLVPALLDAGFQRIAELLYLRRPWRAPTWPAIDANGAKQWPEGVTVVPITTSLESDLAAALEASYEDTADCPELHGLRRIEDVIESHRGTGSFDPSLWWVVRRHGEPAGALLLNQCPDLDHCELVYLGLAPSLRGLGMGRRLLRMGIGALERRVHRALTCAVDARNIAARALYSSEGFEVTTSRTAYVRSLVENM